MASLESAPPLLVADDDPVVRRWVRRALEGFGAGLVLEAEDGLAARELLRERPDVGLVLTDILMPGLDGLELLRWGREHAPDAVWIILSGLDTFDSAVEAIRLGAFDFLAKPPRVEELEVAVRNALDLRALLVERTRLHRRLRRTNRELVERLRELEEKSELLQRDLERAETIQRALLPSAPPPIDRFCLHALYRPGQHVGGDLYDAVRIDDHILALYVADATGHGVTAAMLSVLFKQRLSLRDGRSGRVLPPASVLEAVNRSLREAVSAPGLFLTAVYCLLDTRTAELTVSSAGHPPVFHVPARGAARALERTGPALGLTLEARFDEIRLRLEPGDRLLLYTDGLIQPGAALDVERLTELLRPHPDGAAAVLVDLADRASAGVAAEDRDDVTLLLLEAREGTSRFDNGRREAGPGTAAAADPDRSGVIGYGETEAARFLALRGRATWIHSAAFLDTARAIREGGQELVVDLSRCAYLDSTFLGTIHQLVEEGGVRLQSVAPDVAGLFEELGMERVLASVEEAPAELPELYPLASGPPDAEAGRRRMLDAHEALSALSARNRESFAAVVEALRGDDASG